MLADPAFGIARAVPVTAFGARGPRCFSVGCESTDGEAVVYLTEPVSWSLPRAWTGVRGEESWVGMGEGDVVIEHLQCPAVS